MDVTGFHTKGKFVPKEIATTTTDGTMESVVLFRPPHGLSELIEEDQKRVAWEEKNLGLTWESGVCYHSDIVDHVRRVHRGGLLYVRGSEAREYLQQALGRGVGVFDLQTLGCPPTTGLGMFHAEISRVCMFHQTTNNCATVNVRLLCRWFSVFNATVYSLPRTRLRCLTTQETGRTTRKVSRLSAIFSKLKIKL